MPEIQTSVECCGAMHSTPFCPLCGKDLQPALPLVALLRHVTNQAGRLRIRVSTASTNDACYSRYEKSGMKWEAWRVALSEVVNPVKEET